PPGALLTRADEKAALRVVLVRAVREVEARRVHPGIDELVEHLPGRGGWADRADDLGPAPSERHALTLARAKEVIVSAQSAGRPTSPDTTPSHRALPRSGGAGCTPPHGPSGKERRSWPAPLRWPRRGLRSSCAPSRRSGGGWACRSAA